ncbi:uncharacterized protein LOC110824019 [Carica papaya]|uniref:uncharacterized protein LOC110824019 n=1 Tax=Carica papaya TaxID=3649 RepID=UPI000B8C8690|nr:uncharacterized protein LOC110824019 [Carica papaya]
MAGREFSMVREVPMIRRNMRSGGIPESRRAIELTELLNVEIRPAQVVQGHSPFKNLLKRFENELIVATGKGDPALVMSEYGFKKVVSLDEYASYFEKIDPVSQYKTWKTKLVLHGIVIQFRSICRINHKALEYVTFGKPNPFVFKNAEAILSKLQASCYVNHLDDDRSSMSNSFKTLYIIGDNPAVDIKGAKQAGHPWFSILTRTGVFQGEDNHAEFPADLVVNTVEEAVEYILERESIS